ncbi:MAG: DUF3263 domain-containing protein [Nigerium sp.]|nr:DUF3263 domain-containing protein [Nigerium sp.]
MSDAFVQPHGALGATDAALLDFEASWWAASGSKDAEILARFGMSGPRYYQHLNALIDRPEALAYAPLLVKRLRRLRERRQRDRSARRLSVRSTV